MHIICRNLSVVIPFVFFASNSCWAGNFPKTDADFAQLPVFCSARMQHTSGSPTYDSWRRRLGYKNFTHLHHYCSGLHSENLSYRVLDSELREAYLREAINGFAYMERHAQSDFVLMPEILVRKGKVLEHLQKPKKAMDAYRKALELNPKYSWSYMAIADLFRANDQPEEAERILQKGLETVPSHLAKGLQRRMEELNQASAKTTNEATQ